MNGNCPECGKQVAISRGGDLLEWTEIRWRRKLLGGASLLIPVCLMHALLMGLHTYGAAKFPGAITWPRFLAPEGQELVAIIANVFGALAIWLLASDDAFVTPTTQTFTVHSTIRMLAVITLCSALAFHLFSDFISPYTRNAWSVVAVGLGAVEMFFFYGVMSRLARRLPDTWLARWFGIVRWLLPATGIAVLMAAMVPDALNLGSWRMRVRIPVPGYILDAAIDLCLSFLLARFCIRLMQLPERSLPDGAVGFPIQ